MGNTVNFVILSDAWLSDQESFGRRVPQYKHPCTHYHLEPLFFLFDLYGYAPFVTTIHKPDNMTQYSQNIFYQCEIESAIGCWDFSQEPALYKNCMGMTLDEAHNYSDYVLKDKYEMDWTKGYGWDV